ncbi:hypothetical protein HG531_000752 [Fusarium graminearum]|nr:hypothetical protein HG531_000752 [Fusarium graminearum]
MVSFATTQFSACKIHDSSTDVLQRSLLGLKSAPMHFATYVMLPKVSLLCQLPQKTCIIACFTGRTKIMVVVENVQLLTVFLFQGHRRCADPCPQQVIRVDEDISAGISKDATMRLRIRRRDNNKERFLILIAKALQEIEDLTGFLALTVDHDPVSPGLAIDARSLQGVRKCNIN